jgi:hypothetical protein
LESDLVIEAWATQVNFRMTRTEAVLRDEDGTVYARARGKFIPLSLEETKYVDSNLIYQPGDARIFGFLEGVEVAEAPV